MRSFKYCYLSVALMALCSCGFSEREKKLAEREKELLLKEQQLTSKEQELKLKEATLGQREVKLDSTSKKWDSIGVYNPVLIGEWTVKMSCSETSCEGSAIGDTKTERWVISYENDQVKADAYSGKNLVRMYTGLYKDGVLQLRAQENAEGTIIIADLHPLADKENKMSGTRQIIQSSCKIIYDLDVEKKLASKK